MGKDALKRKFLLLKNHAKPTGDPDCPEEVHSAFNATSTCRRQYPAHPTDARAPPDHEDDEDVGRTELPCSDLQLRFACWVLSYTAKKRRSIDKFIDGAADADAKASSDMMTLFLLMDEWAAKRS
ncbi:hypothetical protein H257_15460 [Aphanomyces astaci]|uniref:Uncharacterized protein n=1 Tax=Aphanomyces astaci TaxID=112090 RepID=W4FPB1_APHAT|nr:hypothetical protein H257_15460 [Aphanomyces astaci]ETV68654.1 hypothetical protein H257_15460 [Aphanomyces astaci]|eukprot:XP_009841879.1 hypothetical protein H257_15460 [Aphanomyces astaci]